MSTSESVASTITAPSEEDPSSDEEDNGEDSDDHSTDTASAVSAHSPQPKPAIITPIKDGK